MGKQPEVANTTMCLYKKNDRLVKYDIFQIFLKVLINNGKARQITLMPNSILEKKNHFCWVQVGSGSELAWVRVDVGPSWCGSKLVLGPSWPDTFPYAHRHDTKDAQKGIMVRFETIKRQISSERGPVVKMSFRASLCAALNVKCNLRQAPTFKF